MIADDLAAVSEALRRDGWCRVPALLQPAEWHALAQRAHALDATQALQPAAIGRAGERRQDVSVRGDRTAWIEAGSTDAAERALQARLEALRQHFNRALFLGLAAVEAHYALYPPGAHYGVHRDRFRDDDARVLSLVLYLNADWQPAHGGALRLYLDAARARHVDVLPHGGDAVLFLSDEFEHEVLPATRERLSVAAWFRRW